MPLARPSGGGFRAPRTSAGGGDDPRLSSSAEASPPVVLATAATPRRSFGLSGGATFRVPKPASPGDGAQGAEQENRPTPASASPPTGCRRTVYYPDPKGRHVDVVTSSGVGARVQRLDQIDYHQPAPNTGRPSAVRSGGAGDSDDVPQVASTISARTATIDPSTAAEHQPPSATAVANEGDAGAGTTNATEDAVPVEEVVSRLPVSPHGKLYFHVSVQESTTKHDATGIVLVDVEASAVQMFDRLGRQYGNRPDPGYPLKESEIEGLKAGSTVKVGLKSVRLVTALHEDTYRSGEFFLRKEHDSRKREEKRREEEAAAAVLRRKAKMSLGGGAFQSIQFRKRPSDSGFVVPLMGRIKGPKKDGVMLTAELRPLHDPDREQALVLFRADYKRDVNGQKICSVVVDPIVGDKLRPHQRVGVQFLYDCVTGARMPGYYGAILADEMGLGKTVQTVATVWTCLRQGKHGSPISRKAIVVAPSSLVRNWCNEFDKWLGEGAVKALAIAESTPKGDRIISRFESEGDVLVISYDQLRKYVTRLSTVRSVDLVVCDEGHRLKNAEIKTSKAVDALPTRRRIVLSGTPIQNDLEEFHAMVGFVNPGILGNMDLFKRVYEDRIMQGRDPDCDAATKELGRDRAHYLATLTKKFILRRTQTINEKYLPPKVDMTVFVNLGDAQRDTYRKISAASAEFQSAPLVLITAMKKLCNHMDLLYEAMHAENTHVRLPKSVLPPKYRQGDLSFTFGAKMNFVAMMLDELTTNGERDKLVIVSNYTQTLTVVAKLCESKRVAFFQLDGSTPIKKRQELVDRFNVPSQREIVFLLSSKAGGVGLNLIGANRLILFDPDWNPANDAQAMGRVWRDGQKKRVYIYRLLSTGTIEEKVYQRQVSKQGLSANVVDMQEDSKQHFTADELRALFTFRSDTLCDTHDLLGCKCQETSTAAGAKTILDRAAPPKMQFKRVDPKKAQVSTGPRMDELKGWDHVKDVQRFKLDTVLRSMTIKNKSLVSFLFANERDAQKLSGPQIERETAFKADDSAITCQSQTGRGEVPGDTAGPEIALLEDDDEDDDEESSDD